MKEKYGRFYLDLEKVSKIEEKEEREIIHSYYKDMMYCFSDGRPEMGESMMHTLINAGYLLDHDQITRDNKINEVLDGN